MMCGQCKDAADYLQMKVQLGKGDDPESRRTCREMHAECYDPTCTCQHQVEKSEKEIEHDRLNPGRPSSAWAVVA